MALASHQIRAQELLAAKRRTLRNCLNNLTIAVLSSWSFETTADRDAVLRLEFPAEVADAHIASRPGRTGLNYGYLLHSVSKP